MILRAKPLIFVILTFPIRYYFSPVVVATNKIRTMVGKWANNAASSVKHFRSANSRDAGCSSVVSPLSFTFSQRGIGGVGGSLD